MYDLPAPRFFRMVARMSAYKGVMRARMEAEAEKTRPKTREELQQLKRTNALSEEDRKAMYWAERLGSRGKRTT
ncbi:hypothetical protein ACPYPG_08215 [Streptomyces sp. FR-108]|uniref:hypothetical protein n=1 Tax=Streptomyces sp. FR-108 TaxID=3416665 RepID=UPI003CF4E738